MEFVSSSKLDDIYKNCEFSLCVYEKTGRENKEENLGKRGGSEKIREPMSRICEGFCVERIWQMWEC